MKFLSLTLPGNYKVDTSGAVPTGGLGAGEGVQKAIQLGLQFAFVIGIVLAIVFVIVSGIQWIISGGDKEKIQGARNRLTYSIIGLVIIIASFLIVTIVISVLGGNPSFFLNTSQ